MGIIPGGRGNDLARVLGIPKEPAGAVAVLAEGHEREIDVGEANGRRFLCIASFGFDSEANRIANEATADPRKPRLRLRGPQDAGRLEARHLHGRARRRGAVRVHRLLGRGRQQPGLRRRHVRRPPRRARRRAPRRGHRQRRQQAPLPGNLPKVFKGTHVENEEVTEMRGARGSRSAPIATSPSTPTASTSPTCRRPCACCPARSG